MSPNPILANLSLCLLTCSSWVLILCSSSTLEEQVPYNSVVVSSVRYPEKTIEPYEWFYMRVELPPQFSAMAVNLVSNADIDTGSVKKLSKTTLPMICFQDGSPPLPDVSDSSLKNLVLHHLLNRSVGGVQNVQDMEQCLFFQKNMMMTFTNEQISPGVWYIGFFNGLGPVRTQSKMITRGSAYLFSANITIEGCTTSTMWGPYCNQTIDILSCTRNEGRQLASNSSILTAECLLTCRNSYEGVCFGDEELKLYSLDIASTTFQLKIIVTDVRLNQTSAVNNTENVGETLVTCYARHNAMPLKSSHDHSGDISRAPLIIQLPKAGRWYFSFQAVNQTKVLGVVQENYRKADLCFSLELQVHECPLGKAGPNCTWESHILQRVLRKSSSVSFESYYLPIGEMMSVNSANFPLEPLLSNSSYDGELDVAWTYFLLDVPHGAAGANIHVQLISDAKVNFEIYARFGGIPSLDAWDYYSNGTSSSNGSKFLSLNDSSEERVNFYILYATEGTWSFGLRHASSNPSKHQISMSIGLEGCPKRCSDHGKCHYTMDESGLTLYSFCLCGRNHGGFDCSIELVSAEGSSYEEELGGRYESGHMWQSVALIASNAAAILPAFWALRQKAFAEWVLFTSSGISSGLYHSCDVGTWCALSFHVLQFMDFWLSFMAVVSTFVYMATIDEVSKRAIHMTVSILTALMAVTGATRSTNIILVIAIGTSGLLIGWMIEFSTANRTINCLPRFHLNISERWQNIKEWICNLIKTLRKRFRWSFIIMGFLALSAAAISWNLETNETYWIWHSLWHINIYTSSFLFLCSTAVKGDNQQYPDTEYELTRQNSSSRGE